jgi:hypothetical protein
VKSLDEDHNQIEAVHFTMNGEHQSVSAPLIVLSAGGINTPALLRTVGVKEAGTKLFFRSTDRHQWDSLGTG